MAKLLYSALGPDGQRTEGFVDASSARDALQQLQAQGLTEVQLHQDLNAPQDESELQGLTPAQRGELARFKLQLHQSPGLRTVLAEVARRNRGWLLADAVLVALGLWLPDRWCLVVGVLAAVLPFAWAAWNFRHADRYQRLLRQFAVGNWDAVRVLAQDLRPLCRNKPVIDFDLDLRLAFIYARDHSLAEALARLEPWRERWATQPGYFEGRVSVVHASAGDTAGYVGLMEQSLALSPDDATRQLDTALAHARFGDAARATALLAGLALPQLPVFGQGFVHWTHGLLQLRQHQPEAEATLGQAVAAFLQVALPVAWVPLALASCDQAIAMHRAGRHDAARERIAQVWPILEVHATTPLLRMLETDDLLPPRRRPH